MKGYLIRQNIIIEDYIYSMISLPLFSSNKKCYFFSIADDNNIFIYKSNKEPKHLNVSDNNNGGLFFELFKKIELCTLTHSLIEINEKYLFAACTNKQTIKIFDMDNYFTEINEIYDINCTQGSHIFTFVPNKNILIVSCTDGFKFISTIKMKKWKSVHCRYSVLCVELFDDNTFICCCCEKNKNIIKQYKIKEKSLEIEKISQIYSNNNDEIWKLHKINERIFFLDEQKEINFFSQIL